MSPARRRREARAASIAMRPQPPNPCKRGFRPDAVASAGTGVYGVGAKAPLTGVDGKRA